MNTQNQITKNDDENPFKDMGFIKFWIVSTVFWFSFPVSLVLCYLALGSVKTKQLVKALVHDFLQTLFIILVVICGRKQDTLDKAVKDIQRKGVNAWGFQADVSKRNEIEILFQKISTLDRSVNILVNNAVTSTSAPFDELTDEDLSIILRSS
jgi:Short-chain dehydrogenases of various substrate specificities